MEKDFKVSVIIPVYNAANFVSESVLSALKLAEVGEVVLVEDGSKDNSLEICQQLAAGNSKVKLFVHEEGKNKGAGESRNLGIQKATFPYVAFLDSDDYYYPNRFANSKEIFLSNEDIDGVYDQVLMINETTGTKKLFGITTSVSSRDLFRYILRGGYFHTNAITLRKDFISKMEPFNQICWPHEDVEMWLRISSSGKLVAGNNNDAVATYRVHGANNITHANHSSRRVLWKVIFTKFFHTKIGMINKVLILKQLFRYR